MPTNTVTRWDHSPDTNGTEESVHISEVFVFHGLNCMHARTVLGERKVLLRCPFSGGFIRKGFRGKYRMNELHTCESADVVKPEECWTRRTGSGIWERRQSNNVINCAMSSRCHNFVIILSTCIFFLTCFSIINTTIIIASTLSQKNDERLRNFHVTIMWQSFSSVVAKLLAAG